MGGNKLLRGMADDGILSYIDYLTAYFEKSLYEFKHLTPIAANIDKLKVIFDVALFGTLLINELDKGDDTLKKAYIRQVKKLYLHDLENVQTLETLYSRELNAVLDDQTVKEMIGFSLSNSRETRPFVCSNNSWGLEPSTLHDFLHDFAHHPNAFSITKLRLGLKKIAFIIESRPRITDEEREFNEWLELNEQKVIKCMQGGRGWKKIIFRSMQEARLSCKQTAAYRYLEKFKKSFSA